MATEVLVAIVTGTVTLCNVVLSALMNYLSRRAGRKQQDAVLKQAEFEKTKEDVQNIALGVQCLLRDEIIKSHEKWHDLKYCPIFARELLTRAYNAYHNLGGNDIATDLYEDTMSLPIEPEEETSEE